ncbi:hypothetical protein FB45DRAFT_887469 [Roridomyces roridus]|uniref:Uncharacterized protein n=1 Tax=Roridomyces roridus TaxID=1738132 RepID=A0AAD7CJA4_9AGAR|nr:hypothetical protein FB45DRAFT_887469 [Roridomyces roridus]
MDHDSESLFGSPPPSPRGRSPSPALALPSASASIFNFGSCAAQNVGTIALPGSQPVSELPVNPLALSLSYPTREPPRPPAQRSDAARKQSAVPTPALPKAKAARKTKAKAPRNTPAPSPPPIFLPDPSDPVPPNLLRNQPGLLGTAGVVGGVRAAHLPSRASQGTTSRNPIVVEDAARYCPPSAKRATPRFGVDFNGLPPPSNQDIVNALLKHQDTVPLLNNILKLIASEAPPPSRGQSVCSSDTGSRAQTPSEASYSTTTTRKRRKLRRVPAGAELWDVPFPFNEGEGPETYRNNWEKHRGKKLIAELVSLIKTAARKAAVANVAEKREKRKVPTDEELAAMGKHYRVNTLFYGKETAEAEVLTDTSNARCPLPAPSPAPSATSLPVETSESSPTPCDTNFDGLISSLLSASNDQFALTGDVDGFCTSPTSSLDPNLFNSWMDIFQTFPTDGLAPPMDQTLMSAPTFPPMENAAFPPSSFDLRINPLLLGPGDNSSVSNFSDSRCPSLAPSPIPSSGSSFSFGPMTPTDGGWSGDAGIGVYTSGDSMSFTDQPSTSQGKKRDFSTMTRAEQEALTFMEVLSKSRSDAVAKKAKLDTGKGKGKAVEEDEDLSEKDVEGDVDEELAPVKDFSQVKTVSIVGRLAKEDVLKRAREKQKELAMEIAKTRIALWETTIEGGVLASLVEYYK